MRPQAARLNRALDCSNSLLGGVQENAASTGVTPIGRTLHSMFLLLGDARGLTSYLVRRLPSADVYKRQGYCRAVNLGDGDVTLAQSRREVTY